MIQAVFLDALGTLLELQRPWPTLVAQLAARGAMVEEAQAEIAMRAEMLHYRENCHTARDAPSLAALRADCTEVLRAGLGPAARDVPADDLEAAMLASLRFHPYPEVVEELHALRAAGRRVVVVSNWDISLHEVLAQTGLDKLVQGVVTSAEIGASKPDPAIFVPALELAGVEPEESLHAGDDVDIDVAGARAAGLRPVLIARDGVVADAGDDVTVLTSLAGLHRITA